MNGLPPNSIGPLDGSQFIVFNSGGFAPGGTIAQTFDTKDGHSYVVKFRVGKLGGGPALMGITAVATASNGAVLGVRLSSQSTTGWGPTNVFSFTATTPTSTLTFEDSSQSGTNTDIADVGLETVSVEPVRPQISISVASVAICWASFSNTLYQVQASSALASDIWTNVGSPVPGNGSTICFTDPVEIPRKYYRVQELP